MRLYSSIDYKEKQEIAGSIYNRPRKNEKEFYIRFLATRTSDSTFDLQLYTIPKTKVYEVPLDETFDCSMTVKDIKFYVEQRVETLKRLMED